MRSADKLGVVFMCGISKYQYLLLTSNKFYEIFIYIETLSMITSFMKYLYIETLSMISLQANMDNPVAHKTRQLKHNSGLRPERLDNNRLSACFSLFLSFNTMFPLYRWNMLSFAWKENRVIVQILAMKRVVIRLLILQMTLQQLQR